MYCVYWCVLPRYPVASILNDQTQIFLTPCWPVFLIAVPTIDRSSSVGYEGHFTLLPTIGTCYLVHLSRPSFKSASFFKSFFHHVVYLIYLFSNICLLFYLFYLFYSLLNFISYVCIVFQKFKVN